MSFLEFSCCHGNDKSTWNTNLFPCFKHIFLFSFRSTLTLKIKILFCLMFHVVILSLLQSDKFQSNEFYLFHGNSISFSSYLKYLRSSSMMHFSLGSTHMHRDNQVINFNLDIVAYYVPFRQFFSYSKIVFDNHSIVPCASFTWNSFQVLSILWKELISLIY